MEVALADHIRALPLFNPEIEMTGPAPDSVVAWRRALSESDAVLIASPEYGHSLPGALKNGIDWVIGSGELHRKIVAITATVRDPARGRRGLRALADTLHAVDAVIVWDAPILEGTSQGADIEKLLQALVASQSETGG